MPSSDSEMLLINNNVAARMLSCCVLCVKANEAWGKRLYRALIEKEKFEYQEEIIVFSSLRLLCSV